jgi:hypothetical protein
MTASFNHLSIHSQIPVLHSYLCKGREIHSSLHDQPHPYRTPIGVPSWCEQLKCHFPTIQPRFLVITSGEPEPGQSPRAASWKPPVHDSHVPISCD